MRPSSSLALHAALCALVSSARAYDDVFPTCTDCLPDSVRQAPGVGVELTDSYAAVSIHHYNGSVSDLALVPAAPAYTALLTRLSSLQEAPSSSWLSESLRKLNRLLGRPSTPDIATLATLLASVRDKLASSLPGPLPKIAISSPPLPALLWRDVHEALALAELEHWMSLEPPYPKFIPSPAAALAARGAAVCTEWRNLYACTDERLDGDLPLERLLSVSLTDASLLATVSRVDDAFTDALASLTVHAASPRLGLEHLPTAGGDDDDNDRARYWSAVRDHIATLARRAADGSHPLTALVLQGSGGARSELHTAIKDAIGPGSRANVDESSGESAPPPMWAAARGAALYARRRQEAPEQCQEKDTCFAGEPAAIGPTSGWIGMLKQKVLGL